MPEGQAMSKMMNLRHQAQLSACSTVTWINSWCFKIQKNVVQIWWKTLDVLLWWIEFRCFSSASLPDLNSGQTLFWTTSIPGCGPGASMIVPYEGSPLQCWHRLTLTQGYGLCVFAKKICRSCVYSPEKSTEASQATQLLLLSSLLVTFCTRDKAFAICVAGSNWVTIPKIKRSSYAQHDLIIMKLTLLRTKPCSFFPWAFKPLRPHFLRRGWMMTRRCRKSKGVNGMRNPHLFGGDISLGLLRWVHYRFYYIQIW